MILNVRRLGQVVILSPEGDLDSEALSRLQNCFLDFHAKEVRKVVFDFSRVKQINYRCLGLLVEETIDFRLEGGDLRLTCLPVDIRDVFRLTGAERAFSIYDTLHDALVSFGLEREEDLAEKVHLTAG